MTARATVCPNCLLPQSKLLKNIAGFQNIATLAVSVLSLVISGIAVWFSMQKPEIEPEISVQIISWDAESFDFILFNHGKAPTIIEFVGIDISLVQLDTLHEAKGEFSLSEAAFLEAGTSKLITVPYASYDPSWSGWKTTGGNDEFSLNFLGFAAQLGNNLNCEMRATYSTSVSFNNRRSKSSSTNGNCISTMMWFAKTFGPLKANK